MLRNMAILDLKSFYFLPHFYEDKMLMITITRKIKISETKMVFFLTMLDFKSQSPVTPGT